MLTEFYDSLLSIIPSFNPQKLKKTKAQLSAMDRLINFHGEEKVRLVFKFAHENDFWKSHVHTAIYLEKKFETLLAQMQKPKIMPFSIPKVDRRTRNLDGTPVSSPHDGRF